MPRNGFVLRGAVITAALALVASLCACCAAPKAASLPPTTLSSATGEVLVLQGDFTGWTEASKGMNLAVGDCIMTGPDGYALIMFYEGSIMELEEEPHVCIKEMHIPKDTRSTFTRLKQRFLVEASKTSTALWMLLLVGISGLSLPFIRLRWGILLIVVLLMGYVVGVFFAFDSGRIMNILYPLITLPLVYITVMVCQVISAQSDKGHMKDLFGRYVSPQVAGEILNLADADQLRLEWARREVTVLFADIRGFTALSERMDPESIVAMLNSYLSVIIDRILANEGMINKFTGDSIMAVWNAPQDQPDHALLAVKAALESQRAIANMQRRSTLPQVQFGIGINSGQAVAGNVGSEGRTEYTLIGDAVNLASRLCSSAPGGHIWIGPQTYEQVKDEVEVEELEPQYFKGKTEPVTVYRVPEFRHKEGTDE